jgi:hypothetical protein
MQLSMRIGVRGREKLTLADPESPTSAEIKIMIMSKIKN